MLRGFLTPFIGSTRRLLYKGNMKYRAFIKKLLKRVYSLFKSLVDLFINVNNNYFNF